MIRRSRRRPRGTRPGAVCAPPRPGPPRDRSGRGRRSPGPGRRSRPSPGCRPRGRRRRPMRRAGSRRPSPRRAPWSPPGRGRSPGRGRPPPRARPRRTRCRTGRSPRRRGTGIRVPTALARGRSAVRPPGAARRPPPTPAPPSPASIHRRPRRSVRTCTSPPVLKRYADARGSALPATIAPCPLPTAQQTKVLKRRDFRPPGPAHSAQRPRGGRRSPARPGVGRSPVRPATA